MTLKLEPSDLFEDQYHVWKKNVEQMENAPDVLGKLAPLVKATDYHTKLVPGSTHAYE